MPKEDFTKWANPDQIAGLVRSWAEGLNRPKNGSFVHLKVKNGQSHQIFFDHFIKMTLEKSLFSKI